jgi:leucyl-tRNA synthetase
MGHVRNYSIGELARYMWMRGFDVLHPVGWDAFGMPVGTRRQNKIIRATGRFQYRLHEEAGVRMGFSYDWSRRLCHVPADYYKGISGSS